MREFAFDSASGKYMFIFDFNKIYAEVGQIEGID